MDWVCRSNYTDVLGSISSVKETELWHGRSMPVHKFSYDAQKSSKTHDTCTSMGEADPWSIVPTREMKPRELLKSSSPSFGRSDCWVMSWDSSHPLASPSALDLG